MFKEMVNQLNTESILPNDLHDTVSTQQVNTKQVDTDEPMLIEMVVARKLLRGNENRCARHAMERAVKETPMKSKKCRQKLAQYVRAQLKKDQSKYMKVRHSMQSKQKANIGSIVTFKMDYRDVSSPHGIPTFGFALSTNDLGQEYKSFLISSCSCGCLFIPCCSHCSGYRISICASCSHVFIKKTKRYSIEMRVEGFSNSLCTTTADNGFAIIG